jgi:hypothetical protein
VAGMNVVLTGEEAAGMRTLFLGPSVEIRRSGFSKRG